MVFVVLCPGTPKGPTGSGSGFKAFQKQGNGLKSHPTDWEMPVIEPATPGLHDIGLLCVVISSTHRTTSSVGTK